MPSEESGHRLDVPLLLLRAGLVGAGFVGLAHGARLWYEGGVLTHKATALLSLLTYFLGFVGLLAALLVRRTEGSGFDLGVTILVVSLIGVGGNRIVRVVPAHGTDALAFNHYAAELVLEGENPYDHSMAPAFSRYGMAERYHTLTATGEKVSSLSYPALSFLVYVPYVAAGGWNLGWVHLAALLMVLLLLLYGVPRPLGLLAGLLLFLDPQVLDLALGGVTDIVYVPLLVGATLAWRNKPWATAVCWGLACAVKQHPWFLAPFWAVAVWKRAHDAETALRAEFSFFGLAGVAFLLPNLPFLVIAPVSWLSGVTTPMFQKLVLYGSGLVSLTTNLGLGLPRQFFSALSAGLLLALLAVYWRFHDKFPEALWILPGMALWFAPRALTSYFVYWAPPLVAALANRYRGPLQTASAVHTDERTPEPENEAIGRRPGPSRRIVGTPTRALACLGAGVLVALAAALLASRTPVSIRISGAENLEDLARIGRVTLRIRNGSRRTLQPRFAAANLHGTLFFWKAKGPDHLSPGQEADYRLVAPSPEAAMPRGVPFRFRVYLDPGGKFLLSPVLGPYRRIRALENRDLGVWQHGRPVAWAWAGSLLSSEVRQLEGGRGACLEVRQDGLLGPWLRAALSQETARPVDRITFRIQTNESLAPRLWPTRLVGLEVVFPRGEILNLVPAGQAIVPSRVAVSGLRTVYFPYETGSWQTFSMDLERDRRAFGYLRPVQVQIRPFVARHRKDPGLLSACFSWVDAQGASE